MCTFLRRYDVKVFFTASKILQDFLELQSDNLNSTIHGVALHITIHAWRPSARYPDLKDINGKHHVPADNRIPCYQYTQVASSVGEVSYL
jgi:hypothetical protein